MHADGPNGLFGLLVKAIAACCIAFWGIVISVFSQTVLNLTIVSWPHLELVEDNSQYSLKVNAEIDVSMLWPLASELDPFDTDISIAVTDPAGRLVETAMGKANFPQLNLKRGKNAVDFTLGYQPFDENLMMKSFIDPMFNDGKQIKIWIRGGGITMHVLGFLPIPARKMNKAMLCNAIAPPAPPPPPPLQHNALRLTNQWKKCLDLPGGDDTNGNKLQLWDCTGASNQQWHFADGRLYLVQNSNKCVDLPGNDYTNGNQLEIWDCNDQPQQQWEYDPTMGTVYLASSSDASKCVDANQGGQVNGAAAQIWDCLPASTTVSQQWQYSGTTDSSSNILQLPLAPSTESHTSSVVTSRRLNSSSNSHSWAMQCFHAHLAVSEAEIYV